MPRPAFKRRKLNAPRSVQSKPEQSRPSRSKRGPKSPTSPQIRQELEKKLAGKTVGARPVDSDDSDDLVYKSSNVIYRRGYPRPTREIFASGGVAKGDTPGSHPSRRRVSNTSPSNQGKSTRNETNKAQSGILQGKTKPALANSSTMRMTRPALPQSAQPSPMPNGLKQLSAAPTPLHGTPNIGVSILGSLKPRKRLPSILRLVDSQDSSSLNFDDEAEFLPDDESTPLHLSKSAAAVATPISHSLQPSSRKRKATPLALTLSNPPAHESHIGSSDSIVQVRRSSPLEPELPLLHSSLKKSSKRKERSSNFDDIMAPPQSSSSSPEPSPMKQKDPSSIQGKRNRKPQLNALSTEALQALMPKRPKVRDRRRQPASEFDVLLDSDEASKSDEISIARSKDDEYSFIPSGKKRRMTRPAAKARTARKKDETKARNKRATSTLSPTKNTRLRDRNTKSPSQLPRGIISASKITKSGAKSYTSLHPQNSRSGCVVDKENLHSDSLGDSSGGSSGHDESSDNLSGSPAKLSVGLQAIKAKFAEIDEWDMDFEEVTEVMSSDPMMR